MPKHTQSTPDLVPLTETELDAVRGGNRLDDPVDPPTFDEEDPIELGDGECIL